MAGLRTPQHALDSCPNSSLAAPHLTQLEDQTKAAQAWVAGNRTAEARRWSAWLEGNVTQAELAGEALRRGLFCVAAGRLGCCWADHARVPGTCCLLHVLS